MLDYNFLFELFDGMICVWACYKSEERKTEINEKMMDKLFYSQKTLKREIYSTLNTLLNTVREIFISLKFRNKTVNL